MGWHGNVVMGYRLGTVSNGNRIEQTASNKCEGHVWAIAWAANVTHCRSFSKIVVHRCSKLFEVLSFSRKEQPFSSTAVSLGFPFCVYAELEA
jgi:hypothetical protein